MSRPAPGTLGPTHTGRPFSLLKPRTHPARELRPYRAAALLAPAQPPADRTALGLSLRTLPPTLWYAQTLPRLNPSAEYEYMEKCAVPGEAHRLWRPQALPRRSATGDSGQVAVGSTQRPPRLCVAPGPGRTPRRRLRVGDQWAPSLPPPLALARRRVTRPHAPRRHPRGGRRRRHLPSHRLLHRGKPSWGCQWCAWPAPGAGPRPRAGARAFSSDFFSSPCS